VALLRPFGLRSLEAGFRTLRASSLKAKQHVFATMNNSEQAKGIDPQCGGESLVIAASDIAQARDEISATSIHQGHCFAMVEHCDPPTETLCGAPITCHGVWKDAYNQPHEVEACEHHGLALTDRFPRPRSTSCVIDASKTD
jgi:hypothetical protein